MQLREATPSDYAYLAANTASRGCFKNQPSRIEFSYALEHDGQVLGIGGIQLLNTTTAWCWMDWAQLGKEDHHRVLYRVAVEWLDIMMDQHRLRRVMASVDATFPEAIRTVEHMGFHREGVMRNFFGDTDGLLYARVR